MGMARRVEPEWLDHLPAHDPRALRSRRDLLRINGLMGNAAIIAAELKVGSGTHSRRPDEDACTTAASNADRTRPHFQLAEIGAGDGGFLLRVAHALGARDVDAILVDRKDAVTGATRAQFAARSWRARSVEADVFDWLRATPPVDAIVANLFLHHFEPPRLAEMLALAAQRARLFVACEPRRSTFALNGARLLGLVGCNDVSRHDAVVSVRAGFRDAEISAMWPGGGAWSVQEGARGLFSHVFAASRGPR
ncbi:MAG: class I SAM-dependent methyltransferase [Usitatibacter sp.]